MSLVFTFAIFCRERKKEILDVKIAGSRSDTVSSRKYAHVVMEEDILPGEEKPDVESI